MDKNANRTWEVRKAVARLGKGAQGAPHSDLSHKLTNVSVVLLISS
jgi:hypothetical protein